MKKFLIYFKLLTMYDRLAGQFLGDKLRFVCTFLFTKGAKIWVYHQNPGHSKYGSEKRL